MNGFLVFLIWAAGSFLAAKLTLALWNWVFLPIARRHGTSLNAMLLTAIQRPAHWAVFSAGLYMGACEISKHYPGIEKQVAWDVYMGVVYVGLVLSATAIVNGAVGAVTEWRAKESRSKPHPLLDDQFLSLFRKIAGFLAFFLAVTVILGHFGVQITGLLATAGVASLAIALAAQETLSNMIAGFALMTDGAFRPGDRVELASGKTGDVLEVGLRSTRIRTLDNTVINIPNSEIAKNPIVNLNAPDARFTLRVPLGVAYGTDIRKVKGLLLAILGAHPDVLKSPAPLIYFTSFGDSALNLIYVCWIADYHDQIRIQDDLNMAIKDRFEAEGIQIPFPQRDIHIHEKRT